MLNQDLHLTLLESGFDRVLDEPSNGSRSESVREGNSPGEALLRDGARDRRFHQLLDALPVAVNTTDAAGRFTFYNEATAELWGCRPGEDLGRCFSNVC